MSVLNMAIGLSLKIINYIHATNVFVRPYRDKLIVSHNSFSLSDWKYMTCSANV